MKLNEKLNALYKNIKLVIYQKVLKELDDSKDSLTPNEYFCLDCIFLLGNPTMTEFADFMDISTPNATYRIRQLVEKGYIKKENSPHDKREFRIRPTEKFAAFYQSKANYGQMLLNDLEDSLEKNELNNIDKVLDLLIEKTFPKNLCNEKEDKE